MVQKKRNYKAMAKIGALSVPFALMATACSNGGAAEGGDEQITLSFSTIYTPESPIISCGYDALENNQGLEDSGISLNLTHSSQLGSENELMEQVSSGQIDIALSTGSTLSTVFGMTDMEMYDTFFLYEDLEQYNHVLQTDVAQDMWSEVDEVAGVQVVGGPWLYGERHMFGNTPIRTIDDFEGIRARTTPVDIYVDSLEALGADPTTTAYDEIYMALQQGIFDVGEAPLSIIKTDSFDEPSDYVSLTGHLLTGLPPVINSNTLESLSDDQQSALTEAFDEGSEAVAECLEADDEAALEEWENSDSIEVIHDVDIEPMREAVRESYTSDYPWSDAYQELLDEMESM